MRKMAAYQRWLEFITVCACRLICTCIHRVDRFLLKFYHEHACKASQAWTHARVNDVIYYSNERCKRRFYSPGWKLRLLLERHSSSMNGATSEADYALKTLSEELSFSTVQFQLKQEALFEKIASACVKTKRFRGPPFVSVRAFKFAHWSLNSLRGSRDFQNLVTNVYNWYDSHEPYDSSALSFLSYLIKICNK